MAKNNAKLKSKARKRSGARATAGSQNQPGAPVPRVRTRSAGSAGLTKKPGAAGSHGSETGAESKVRSTPRARRAPVSFPIVGVGASAGGLDAFKQLLEELPADT